MENDKNNGFRMRQALALNRHWYDALADYLPTRLTIDNDQLEPKNKFIQALKQENLTDLKHFTINGLYDTESFDVNVIY